MLYPVAFYIVSSVSSDLADSYSCRRLYSHMYVCMYVCVHVCVCVCVSRAQRVKMTARSKSVAVFKRSSHPSVLYGRAPCVLHVQ